MAHEPVNPYAPPSVATEIAPIEASNWNGYPAERSTRFWAYFVDVLLYIPTVIPGLAIYFVQFDGFDNSDDLSNLAAFYGLLLPLPLLLASYQWYLVATTGQSLAKRWFGIKVVRLDGTLPGFVNGVLLRSWVLHALNMVCNLIALVDALMIFGEESRCLHDQIAGTRVIKV